MMLLSLVGAVLAAFWWVSSAGQIGAWPLLIVAPLFTAAILQRTMPRRTPLDLPVLLLLLTALVGVWATYDRDAAQHKLWLLVAAILLFYAIAWQSVPDLHVVAALLAALGLAVALYFLLTHDWQAIPPQLPGAHTLTRIWSTLRPPTGWQPLHPNNVDGVMAFTIPFQFALLLYARRRRSTLQSALSGVALLITAGSLLLTSSLGAMLAPIAGLAAWFIWDKTQSQFARLQPHKGSLLALLALLLLVVFLVARSGLIWQVVRIIEGLPGSSGVMERAIVAGYTLDLIGDFGLTGAGLATFPGLYSQYILNIPYLFQSHSNNILLDITLEQGLGGILSFSLIIITTFALVFTYTPAIDSTQAKGLKRTLTGAAIASFTGLLFHGLVEDSIYGSAALPLLLVAPAMIAALNHSIQPTPTRDVRRWYKLQGAVLGLVVLLLFTTLLIPQGRARLASNLGAISMARTDLAHFPAEEWTLAQETPHIQEARSYFQQALHDNPTQRTALHRLGLLAFQQNDFERAIIYLQNAHNLDPYHIGIRKALGYSYAWAGNPQEAHTHLQAAPFVAQELEAYVHWWQQRGHPERARIATRIRQSIQQAETIQ